MMEAAVQIDIAQKIVCGDTGAEHQRIKCVQALVQTGEIRFGRPSFGRKPRGQTFERAAHLDGGVDVAFGEGADSVAAGRDGVRETFLLKPHHRGADRRARYAKPLDQRQFGQAFAGLHFAAEDQFAQRHESRQVLRRGNFRLVAQHFLPDAFYGRLYTILTGVNSQLGKNNKKPARERRFLYSGLG
jgi:hypothetical protein